MKMKFLFFVFLFLFCFPDTSQADTDTANSGPATTTGRHAKMKTGSPKGEKKNSSHPSSIRGHCTLLASPMNPITGDCVSVPLVIQDNEGHEIAITRTDGKGSFSFELEQDVPYTIAPTSKMYKLVSPARPVHMGQSVDLKIQEKN